jgi:hypothetical protein
MEKRYQVFVSSTYTDLKDERQQVMQALMEMDCIPAGMELFPAADEEQWQFIQRVIDDCDYYLLIIGGRYGSVTKDGISFTEKEYKYAKSKKLKVVALVHESPEELPAKYVEADPELKSKLESFREQVTNSRLVKFWNNTEQLIGLVALSMQKTIKMYPSTGWVRASSVTTEELLIENNHLKEENAKLHSQLKRLTASDEVIGEIKDRIPHEYVLEGTGMALGGEKGERVSWKAAFNLRDIFVLLAPYIAAPMKEMYIEDHVDDILAFLYPDMPKGGRLETRDLKELGMLLRALKLIDIEHTIDRYGDPEFVWTITELGDNYQMAERLRAATANLTVPK